MPPKANADQADSLGDNELTRLADRFGADKGSSPGRHRHPHLYTPIYQRFLAPLRERPIRLLEIGVFKGASLRMWEIYLPHAQIVGVDIDPRRAEHASQRAAVAIGDATDPEFLRDVLDRHFGGTVDVVIDDGSHILEEMIVTLETLFPRLSDDGLYFIEDICASRFEGFHRGEKPFSDFLDYLSSVAEQLTFFADFRSGIYHSIRDTRELSKAGVEPPPRSLWNERLAAVHLFHNLCVLTKGPRDFPYDPSRTAEGRRSDPYIPAREGQGFRLATIEAEVDRLRSELSATRDALAKWAAEAGQLSTELSAAVETLTDREAEAVRLVTEHSGANEALAKGEAEFALQRRQLREIRTSSSSLMHRRVKADTALSRFGSRIAKLSLIARSLVLKPARKRLRKLRARVRTQ